MAGLAMAAHTTESLLICIQAWSCVCECVLGGRHSKT